MLKYSLLLLFSHMSKQLILKNFQTKSAAIFIKKQFINGVNKICVIIKRWSIFVYFKTRNNILEKVIKDCFIKAFFNKYFKKCYSSGDGMEGSKNF